MAQSKQRLQVAPILSDRIQAADKVEPVAAPVNTYYHPNLPPPVLQNVIDLAPLSQTLSAIATAHGRVAIDDLNKARTAEAAKEENLQAYVDPGTSKAWADKLRKGEIDETQSPYFYKTQKGVAGRRLAQIYERKMEEQWGDLTSVNDGLSESQGSVGGPRLTFEQAHAKAIESLQESAAFADPLVRQEFDLAIFEWGADFHARADGALREAQKEFTYTGLQEEAVKFLQTRVENGWQPDDGEALAAWDKQLRVEQPSIKDPRVLIVNAALSEAANLSRQNKNEDAKALLMQVAGVNIGGMELGENPAFASDLDKAIDTYEIEASREGELLAREEQKNTETAQRKAENEIWGPELAKALAAGENPEAVINQLLPQFQQFGKYADEVMLDALTTARNARNLQQSDPSSREAFVDALTNWDYERAALIFETSKDKWLPGDRLDARDQIEKVKQSSRDLDRDQLYQSAAKALQDAHKNSVYQKVQGKVLSAWDSEFADDFTRFEEGARALLPQSVTPEGRKALDDYIRTGRDQLIQKTQERAKLIQEKQQSLGAELDNAINHLQPIDQILNDSANEDYLTPDIRQQYMEAQSKVEAELEEKYWRNPQTDEVLDKIEALTFTALGEAATEQDVLNQLAVRQRFFQIFAPKLQEKLATAPPQSRYSQAYLPALMEAQAELLAERGSKTTALENVKAGAKADAPEKVAEAAAFESAANDFYFGGIPAVPETIQGAHRANVEAAIKESPRAVQAWASGYIDQALKADISDSEKRSAIGDALRVVGLKPEDVLKGEASFTAPTPWMTFNRSFAGLGDPVLNVRPQPARTLPGSVSSARMVDSAKSLSALAEAEAWLAKQSGNGPAVQAVRKQVEAAKALMQPRTFDIAGLKLNPYTDIKFESLDQLKAWASDTARWTKLKAAAGIGATEEEDQTFYNFLRERIAK